MADYGYSFAPTNDNAMMGGRNGQLAGVPEATQVISLRLPRVVGARAIAPTELLNPNGGGQGVDPTAAAILQTLLRTMRGQPPMGQPGSLPGGTAGPANPFPGGEPPRPGPGGGGNGGGREGSPFPSPMADPPLMPVPSTPKPPRVIPQDDPNGGRRPGGGWTPGGGPYFPGRRVPGV